MMEFCLIHYHEIALKGKNRKFFEKKLIENIKRSLKGKYFQFVKRFSGRILLKLNREGAKDEKRVKERLKNIFGIANFSFAQRTSQNLSKIKEEAFKILKKKKFKTFRITARRGDKKIPLSSKKINEKLGAYIKEKLKKKVDLENYELNCFIELVGKSAFIYLEKIKGLGGLPVSVSGKGISLLSGGIDSPVASFLMMKRGVQSVFVHFHAFPFTERASIEKAERIAKLLSFYQYFSKLYLVPFFSIQKEIMAKTPKKLRIILYRRMMFRLCELIAKKEKAKILITGESVGQVASQTPENIYVIEEATNLPVLRPLIGFDKQEIIDLAKKIRTYDISILPHQDCCSLFIPSHPETKANLKEVKKAEKNLKILKLISQTFKKIEIKKFEFKN